jgi:type IV secretory pathway VirD2 relaxase
MLVGERIAARIEPDPPPAETTPGVRLPPSMRPDKLSVRVGLMRRLASSRTFAFGDRSGVLRAAQKRSGRPFRLDVRQRVIVKALICRHTGKGAERSGALAKHVAYLGREGAGSDGSSPGFFDRVSDAVHPADMVAGWKADRHHFRFIISPEHGDRIVDLKTYVRDVMARVAADLGESTLEWRATCHYDTDQPHAHVLVRGRRGDGRDLVIPRDYIAYGFRARAQEAAQERLGDLSRQDAERRVWRATQADQFTALDRRLIAAQDSAGRVEDGVGGTDAWAALSRGRLRHLEALGLATREGRRYRLHPDMETKLRTLQIRRDIIRTMNQRRLEAGAQVRQAQPGQLRGRVVQSGFHDELGARPYVIVRNDSGVDAYVRMRPGGAPLPVGRDVSLNVGARGVAEICLGRGSGAGL